jgi:hypothetical protein
MEEVVESERIHFVAEEGVRKESRFQETVEVAVVLLYPIKTVAHPGSCCLVSFPVTAVARE